MENTNKTENNWDETKEKLKQKFISLTESDVLFTKGKKEEMLTRLQLKLGKSKEEIQNIIESL